MLTNMNQYAASENYPVNEHILHDTDKIASAYAGVPVLSLNSTKLDASIPVTVERSLGTKSFRNAIPGGRT